MEEPALTAPRANIPHADAPVSLQLKATGCVRSVRCTHSAGPGTQLALNVCLGKGGRRPSRRRGSRSRPQGQGEGLCLHTPLTWARPCRPVSGSLPWLLATLQVGDDVWLADWRPCVGRKRQGSGRPVCQARGRGLRWGTHADLWV